MTLTKWNADLIDGLDVGEDVDVGEMEGVYLPSEGGTLTGELTVDANLILEGTIAEGERVLDKLADSEFTRPPEDPAFDRIAPKWPQIEYILSPSRGVMQHLTVPISRLEPKGYDDERFDRNSLFVIAPDQSEWTGRLYDEEDQDYLFEDGQSMTIRIEVEDLDRHKADRYQCAHRWHDDIWWVNTKDGLAPDLNETGSMTINLWKAKGIVYGQLAGNYVKEREYHPDAFDFSKLKNRSFTLNYAEYTSEAGLRPWSSTRQEGTAGDPFVWNPEGGIVYRQGTTFARTSRDGRHFFIGQSGSDGWFDPEYPDHNNKLYPGELRVFGNSIASLGSKHGEQGVRYADTFCSTLPQPFDFHWEGRHSTTMSSTDSKLLGTATDMRLRVDKGTGADFNPDGTRMFQSVACYHDPSLKDKYKNVIGYHQLVIPWDVGTTDFFQQEKLNDIIYCDEKYSDILALHPEHPDMRICGLTFRPDGMGFYFAYVLYSLDSQNIEYYFVQQDLTVPWELSSAKEEYKYSDKISHLKAPINSNNGDRPNKSTLWQINGITVSQNGRFIHAVYPHNCIIGGGRPKLKYGLAKPRQFEMTTPWDISTAGNMYVGIDTGKQPGYGEDEMTHAVHWNESGEQCYFSFVPECQPGQDREKNALYRQYKYLLNEDEE